MNKLFIVGLLSLLVLPVQAAELAGVSIKDQVTAGNGEVLVLNGIGLREKFWIDVYVGSLYLVNKSSGVAEILSAPNASRIQMDFVHKEVASEKLIKAWNEGFEKNQSSAILATLQDRIDRFNSFFNQNALAKDQYIFDYIPDKGTTVIKNNTVLGLIPGQDFKNALLEIWLGNFPADKSLKRGLLGLK
ncbi:MAG: chalcone isomerase family protein [Gammaproteobacteria bacterium]|nr:chalcone isomerase family protein [Gammaproteobacteria bacterium]